MSPLKHFYGKYGVEVEIWSSEVVVLYHKKFKYKIEEHLQTTHQTKSVRKSLKQSEFSRME